MGASLTWITMLQSESVIFHGKATLLHPIIIQSLLPKAFPVYNGLLLTYLGHPPRRL